MTFKGRLDVEIEIAKEEAQYLITNAINRMTKLPATVVRLLAMAKEKLK
jgi:hypothetical protein